MFNKNDDMINEHRPLSVAAARLNVVCNRACVVDTTSIVTIPFGYPKKSDRRSSRVLFA